jgi:hypothetical protein
MFSDNFFYISFCIQVKNTTLFATFMTKLFHINTTFSSDSHKK